VTAPPAATPRLLHHLFDEVAARHPDRVAIDVPPNAPARPRRIRVTYRDLAARADRVAAQLAAVARPDAVVAVYHPRHSPDLYAAQLGVLKAGAAYTCLDPSFPDDHARRVIADAVALVTDAAGLEWARRLGVGCPVVTPGGGVPRASPGRDGGDPSRLAYVIYTSGTTGTPKGVMIEHAGVVNLVEANVREFALTPDDRVAQCSSPAYDSSVEETWLAFAAGATLVPLDDETVRLGPDLVVWLRTERVSVLCPPPTLLLATGCEDPAAALPGLRLLYVGGEPLPQAVADRWARGRRMVNGYGPTECTVTVVRGPVTPGSPVTIGTPVAGHRAWVVNDDLDEVPPGEEGELCVGGPGLARGYRGLGELTAAKFPVHPRLGRVFRTGDAARRTPAGDLVHLGRLDGQVKLRGHRVELAAIEAVLARCPGVRAAGCRVQGEGPHRVIAAHVVPAAAGAPPAAAALREELRRQLPPYMVPGLFGFLDRLPTQVGGKLDRAALPTLAGPTLAGPTAAPPPDGPAGDAARAFAAALGLPGGVGRDDDFFLDLGGDSLRAVTAVLALRGLGYGSVAVRNLYDTRTPGRLAGRLRKARPEPEPRVAVEAASGRESVVGCTAVQSAWLLTALVTTGGFGYVLAAEALPAAAATLGLTRALLAVPLVVMLGQLLSLPATLALAVATKWLLVGRYRPGRFPVWGMTYARHWVVTRTARLVPWGLVEGTVFTSALLRALGARVGRRVYIHAGVDLTGGGWDLLTLGDGVTVGPDARLSPVELADGHVVVGPVTVGDGGTLAARSGVSPGGAVGRNGFLTALSWLPPGASIPAGERWDGVPAAAAGPTPPPPAVTGGASLPPVVHGLLVVGGRCLAPLAAAVALLAVAAAVPDFDARTSAWLAAPELSWAGVVTTVGFVVAAGPASLVVVGLATRLAGRVQPGVVGLWSVAALRVEFKTGAVDAANRWLSGALLWPWWLRLAGMRVGRGCEISTLIDAVPETVTLGDGCFLTDGIYLGCPVRHGGTLTVAATALGRGTFVGNQAVVPAGHSWPAGLFVGVSTPADHAQARPGSAWFGHPPMELPRREVATAARRDTQAPGLWPVARRLFWEALRFALPVVPLAAGVGWYWCVTTAPGGVAAKLLVVAPLATLATGAGLAAAGIGVKWAVVGRVRPGQHALWSGWCSRWDFMYVAWGYLAQPPASALEGTLMLNALLRLTGMHIGRRVIMAGGSSQVVDPDMLTIEDGATVSADFQAHTFEDRVLKIGRVRVGSGATAGPHAVVLYGADIEEWAVVAPHSVVMKGDVLGAGGNYAGCPTKQWIPVS
jgi:non-ribosomal peptide synthetase-like protein